MPLKIETHHHLKGWTEIGRTEGLGSVSHNPEGGGREIYMFFSEGDKSFIYRSKGGVDRATSEIREITNLKGWELVKELGFGESHTMDLRSDTRKMARTVRFTHV